MDLCCGLSFLEINLCLLAKAFPIPVSISTQNAADLQDAYKLLQNKIHVPGLVKVAQERGRHLDCDGYVKPDFANGICSGLCIYVASSYFKKEKLLLQSGEKPLIEAVTPLAQSVPFEAVVLQAIDMQYPHEHHVAFSYAGFDWDSFEQNLSKALKNI